MRKLLPLITLPLAAVLFTRVARRPAAPAPTRAPTTEELLAWYLNQPSPSVVHPADLMPSWSVDDPRRPPAGPLR